MTRLNCILSLLILLVLNSCNDSAEKEENKNFLQPEEVKIESSEVVDINFNVFLEKFSSDSNFQKNRTKFPLRIKQYDFTNDQLLVTYNQETEFEMMDLRKSKSDSHSDQWTQKIKSNKNSVIIEIRGIDNGISVDYIFERIKDEWMLVEVDDSST